MESCDEDKFPSIFAFILLLTTCMFSCACSNSICLCISSFFYETVAPILSIGNASLVAISTLTSEINFYTRLIKMTDPATGWCLHLVTYSYSITDIVFWFRSSVICHTLYRIGM